MAQTEFLFISTEKEIPREAAEVVQGQLLQEGITRCGDFLNYAAPPGEISRLAEGGQPSEKQYHWLHTIDDTVINGAAEWDNPLYGCRLLVAATRDYAEHHVDNSELPPNVKLRVRSAGGKRQSNNAPFSYDPNQDYSTEL